MGENGFNGTIQNGADTCAFIQKMRILVRGKPLIATATMGGVDESECK